MMHLKGFEHSSTIFCMLSQKLSHCVKCGLPRKVRIGCTLESVHSIAPVLTVVPPPYLPKDRSTQSLQWSKGEPEVGAEGRGRHFWTGGTGEEGQDLEGGGTRGSLLAESYLLSQAWK